MLPDPDREGDGVFRQLKKPSYGLPKRAFDASHFIVCVLIASVEAHHDLGDRIEYADSAKECAQNADALVLVTEWNEFRRPDFGAIKAALKEPVVFDGRNIWTRKTLEDLGFTYHGIGR